MDAMVPAEVTSVPSEIAKAPTRIQPVPITRTKEEVQVWVNEFVDEYVDKKTKEMTKRLSKIIDDAIKKRDPPEDADVCRLRLLEGLKCDMAVSDDYVIELE